MNLLKIAFVVIIAASLALLLSNHAAALDHPWDDRPTDTSTTCSNNVDGHPTVTDNSDDTDEVDQLYVKVQFWFHWVFGGVDAYIIGQKVQQAESCLLEGVSTFQER